MLHPSKLARVAVAAVFVAVAVVGLGVTIAALFPRANPAAWPGLHRLSAQRQAVVALQNYHADTGTIPTAESWVDAITPYLDTPDTVPADDPRHPSHLRQHVVFRPVTLARSLDSATTDQPRDEIDTIVLYETALFQGDLLLAASADAAAVMLRGDEAREVLARLQAE
ncbi:MAG: hypothetical protein AAF297_04065 [Planctomycetota bacterium]